MSKQDNKAGAAPAPIGGKNTEKAYDDGPDGAGRTPGEKKADQTIEQQPYPVPDDTRGPGPAPAGGDIIYGDEKEQTADHALVFNQKPTILEQQKHWEEEEAKRNIAKEGHMIKNEADVNRKAKRQYLEGIGRRPVCLIWFWFTFLICPFICGILGYYAITEGIPTTLNSNLSFVRALIATVLTFFVALGGYITIVNRLTALWIGLAWMFLIVACLYLAGGSLARSIHSRKRDNFNDLILWGIIYYNKSLLIGYDDPPLFFQIFEENNKNCCDLIWPPSFIRKEWDNRRCCRKTIRLIKHQMYVVMILMGVLIGLCFFIMFLFWFYFSKLRAVEFGFSELPEDFSILHIGRTEYG